ncbi:MAG: hypothetical protein LBJ13_01300 [Puniceicoccales bacterium]|nr:hypothetical protein [Puniceicoccales bacterium]
MVKIFEVVFVAKVQGAEAPWIVRDFIPYSARIACGFCHKNAQSIEIAQVVEW